MAAAAAGGERAPRPPVLCIATHEESVVRDAAMYRHWGGDWPRDLFLAREAALVATPWTARKVYWVLKRDGGDGPIVANCETYTVPSLLDGDAGCVHILTSIFVDADKRRCGYGAAVIREVIAAMEARPPPAATGVDHAHACALFSEIGAEYYARLGFRPAWTSNYNLRLPVPVVPAPPPIVPPPGLRLYYLRDPALPELAALTPRRDAGDAAYLQPPQWPAGSAGGALRTEGTPQQAAWQLVYSKYEHMHAGVPQPPACGVLVVADTVPPDCAPTDASQVAGYAVWKADFDHDVLQLLTVCATSPPVAATLAAAARHAASGLHLPAVTAFLAADDAAAAGGGAGGSDDKGGDGGPAAAVAAATPTARWLLGEPGAEVVPRVGALPMYRPCPKRGGADGETWEIGGWAGVERVTWC